MSNETNATTSASCPVAAEPQPEHAWLEQLVGKWTFDGECVMGPNEPTIRHAGKEVVRPFGKLWVISEGHMEMPDGEPMINQMTLGYDPDRKCFVGSFIASMMAYLWVYEAGSLDADRRTLTLPARGPSMTGTGEMVQYEDTIEVIDADRRILRARVLGEDGEWRQFMQTEYRRVRD
jgi:hypothetical protein